MDDDFFYNQTKDEEFEKQENDIDTSDEINEQEVIDDEDINDDEFNEDNDYYDEKELPNSLKDDFTDIIMKRGKDYYRDGNIISLFKNGNEYYVKVEGSNGDIYNVKIAVEDNDIASYQCDCPYEFNCKHEYATLLAIASGEYKEINLKEVIKEKELSLRDLIKAIPSEELKAYLLSNQGMDHVHIDLAPFTNYFSKYLPEQDNEYYYNNLYNALVMEEKTEDLLNDYFSKVRNDFRNLQFSSAFKIIKEIVLAYHDSNKMNLDEEFFLLMQKVGMFLRIIYRKGDLKAKEDVQKWKNELANSNYYDNYYLEDIMLTIN